MNKSVQSLTLGDKEFVVLSRDDYEEMIDVIETKQIKERIASGEEELIPSDVADALLDGKNPVRVWRKHRGMTARDLAKQAEISSPYLSEIENGKKDGSISAMKRIATVLDVDLDDLV